MLLRMKSMRAYCRSHNDIRGAAPPATVMREWVSRNAAAFDNFDFVEAVEIAGANSPKARPEQTACDSLEEILAAKFQAFGCNSKSQLW